MSFQRLWLGLALMAIIGATQAGTLEVRPPHSGVYSVRLTSLKEARFSRTVQQKYDYSCGSAATATLLTYQYGVPVTEADVFKQMYVRGDQQKIRREGFSLLDMKNFLQANGFEADGFELPLEKLSEEGLPAIVLLNDRGYRHFVVVKGLQSGRVLLGDPSRGTRAMPRRRFEQLWDNRVLFVVHNRRALARFNHPQDWRTAPPAPLASGVQRDGLRNVVIRRLGVGDI